MTQTTPICMTTVLIAMTSAATAQFSGAYAPDTWIITGAGLDGSAAVFAPDGASLTMTGSDGGFYANIDVVHTVLTGGIWAFDWSFVSVNYTGYDNAYYLLNGTPVFLAPGDLAPWTGSESVKVQAGDVIGWRVESVDGIFGPGVLTIANFQIPAPGVMALLAFVGIARYRCRPIEPPGQA